MKSYATLGLLSVIGLVAGISAVIWMVDSPEAEAHCQVPCGIYDDASRIKRLMEDAATIHKAMGEIKKNAGKHDPQAFNQATRWVITKEEHASHVISVVSEYFLTQKVKPVAKSDPGYEAYLKKLADHHAVMAAAMKAKQNSDTAFADSLVHAIESMAVHYKK